MLQHTKHQLNGIALECLTTPCVLFFSSRTPTAEQLSKTNFDKDNQLGLVTNLKIAGSCWGGVVTEFCSVQSFGFKHRLSAKQVALLVL